MKRNFFAIGMLAFVTPAYGQDGSNWLTKVRVDPMTDVTNASATLMSTSGDKLAFVCNGVAETTISIQYHPKGYLGSIAKLVMIRFDKDPPLPSALWEYVGKAAYTTSEPSIEWFSNQVGDGSRTIKIRALDYNDQPVDAEFVSFGGRSAVNAVRKTCGKQEI